MQLKINKPEEKYIRLMHKHGEVCGTLAGAELQVGSGWSTKTLSEIEANNDLVHREKRDVVIDKTHTVKCFYWLDKSIQKLQKTDLDALIKDALKRSKEESKLKPVKINPQMRKRAKEIEQDEEKVEFIRINAAYQTIHAISRELGEHVEVLKLVAQSHGIDTMDEDKDPRAADIRGELGFLNVGTAISQWVGGTSVHLKSDTPGIIRVTRHFVAE